MLSTYRHTNYIMVKLRCIRKHLSCCFNDLYGRHMDAFKVKYCYFSPGTEFRLFLDYLIITFQMLKLLLQYTGNYRYSYATGNWMVNVTPSPSLLSTFISPPCALIIS